jgi:hypothetical protein
MCSWGQVRQFERAGMGGLHGGGVGEAYDDAVGGGLNVFDGAILWQQMVSASGIGNSGVDGMVQVVCLVDMRFATWSRGVRKLLLFRICVFTNSFVRPPPHHQVLVRCICCWLPPSGLVTVTVSRCPYFLKMHMILVCLFAMSNPQGQQ